MKVNQNRLVDSFLKLVQIDSESGNENEIIAHLQEKLAGLGFDTTIDKVGNLIGSNGNNPTLALTAHVDTVKPGRRIKPIVTDTGVIKTDGTTILGGDDKCGVASILEIINTLNENQSQAELEVVFTVSEEIGLIGSTALDFSKIKSTRALNIDSEPGDIIIGEPANMHFDIEVIGKAAHAGDKPENGINSIQITSEAISSLQWGRIDDETTTNVGVISGGLARNIVPANTKLEAEVRSRNKEKFEQYCHKLEDEFYKAAKKYSGELNIKSTQRAWPYVISKDDELVQAAVQACEENNTEPKIQLLGANTDGDNFNAHDIKTITLGSFGADIHTTNESVNKSEITLGTQIALNTVLILLPK